jgi:hypothetical protein
MTADTTSEIERGRWRKDFNMQIVTISSKNNYEDINLFLDMLKENEK